MIHLKETFPDDHTIVIQADGILDEESLPLMKKIFEQYWQRRRILLRMEGLRHISREGRDFLTGMQDRVTMINPPPFMKWESGGFKGEE